ncbi:MAG: PAS domain S-box protein, partial [Anaerolineae bacterium]
RDYARPVWDDARQKVTRIFGAAQDITERKRVEEAMTTERSLLRTLVDNLPDSVYVKDLAGRKTLANPADIRKMGVASAAEALGKTDFEVFPPDLAAPFDADDQHVIQTGQPVLNREERFILPDGSQGWQLTSKAPLRDRAGQVIGLVGVGHDITERKRAEEALRESEARFRVIFERANDAIHVDNADDQILQVNPRMGELMGYSREELLTMRVSDLQAPEVRGQSGNVVRNELARHGHVAFESLNLHRSGRRIPVEVSVACIESAQGDLYVSIVRDITERKQAEEEQRKSAEELQWLFKSMINAFVIFESVFDDGGNFISYRFVYINDAYERITGVKNEEVKSKTVHEVWPETEPEWVKRYGEVAVTGISQTFDLYHDPTRKLYHCIVYRPWNRKDRFCVIFEDITERKRAEEERERLFQEVQRARDQLQALSRRLVEVQETERRHIARELHDEVGQLLTGLKMLLETNSHLPADTLRSRLSNAQSLVEQLLEQVQGMSLDLRPTMLDDLGLLPALLWFAKRFADQTGVRVHLEHAGLDRRFASEIETAVYRIVQEALTNVARHADVKEAIARLWATQDTLHVQVEDRGKGFHVQAALVAPISSGLSGMRERAVALGGNLMIESTPGVGTHVVLEVPLSGSLERKTKEGRE